MTDDVEPYQSTVGGEEDTRTTRKSRCLTPDLRYGISCEDEMTIRLAIRVFVFEPLKVELTLWYGGFLVSEVSVGVSPRHLQCAS